MALIQVIKGPHLGQQFDILRERTVLGRHPDCDIVLEVAAISRQHAQIICDDSRFFIEDLGSRNGTIVNGHAISRRAPLNDGDRVLICDLEFSFHHEQPSELLAGPMPHGNSGMLLVDDAEQDSPPTPTIMSTIDVMTPSRDGLLSVRPEVKLKAMLEIAQSLGKALDLGSVLPKLLDSLFRVFVQADRGFIVLRGANAESLVPKAVKYRRPGEDASVRISRTIVEKAMLGKEAILSADAASDERFNTAQSIADFHIRSLMCAPLINGEGVALGVIQIDTLDQRSRFTADDLEVLASVAAQAAIAIDNAQMHERALRQEALRRDLELAHQVQVGLLPAAPPQLAGYEFFDFYGAAHEVGGDYYDYVPLPDGRIAVVLGDVSGKGVSAALLMAKLSGEVRFCLASEAQADDAVTRINQMFARSGWNDRFVTFVAAIVDPVGHELIIINAGHMPPLLRRADGTVEEIGNDQAGLPLGVTDDYQYEAYRCTLNPGDYVILFTDGISEAFDADRRLYGLDRIRQKLAASHGTATERGQQLLEDLRDFVGGHPQSDDMCLALFGRST